MDPCLQAVHVLPQAFCHLQVSDVACLHVHLNMEIDCFQNVVNFGIP